jgi:transcriptional regulator with XRE-family HTH domain
MTARPMQRRRWSDVSVAAMEFDTEGFARGIYTARTTQNLSTRDVARRAGISQAYVVALERARSGEVPTGPTPTVDVLAKLASALSLNPEALFRQSTRPVGQHVLLVLDHPEADPLHAALRAAQPKIDVWLSTSDIGHHVTTGSQRTLPITVHGPLKSSRKYRYDPDAVQAKLHGELKRNRSAVQSERIGLVFDEMAKVMAAGADPEVIVGAEHQWEDTVCAAAAAVGAHAVWNVCAYRLDSLRTLPDPVDAVTKLAASHDQLWLVRKNRISKQEQAWSQVLRQLRRH